MKFLIFTVALCLAVVCHQSQLTEANDELDQLLLDMLEDTVNEADELEERSYTESKQAPSRLRGCIQCVGEQRSRGKNVKQATKHCNQVCKRELFEDDEEDEGFEERGYKAEKQISAKLKGCIQCVGEQRSKGKNVKQATKHCNQVCKRELFEDDEEDEGFEERGYKAEKQAPERLRGCIHCVGEQRAKGKNVKQATKHCNSVCKREIFDTNDQF